MFGLFDEIAKGVGSVVGAVVGGISSVPILIIAKTLSITQEMVIEAISAGCETYEEIRDFFNI